MTVISDEELLQILDRQLPEMLERNPELEPRAFRAFMKAFATKESVAAVLDELRALDAKVLHFRAEAVSGNEQVREELRELRTEMDRRFDEVDRCFDEVDRRFDEVDRRFDEVDRRFDVLEGRMDRLERKFDDLKDWTELIVGRFQVRSGRRLEDVVAGALRLALERPDISAESIRLRQKLVDEQGIIGPAGRKYEVDILAEDDRLLVFEVKSVCEREDVYRLADKVHLMRTLHPDCRIEGVLIALAGERGVKDLCQEHGIAPVLREET